MTEAAAGEMLQGGTEMPPALQRLWKRRSTMSAPLPEDINLGVLEDLLLQSAQSVDDYVPVKHTQNSASSLLFQHKDCEEAKQKSKAHMHLHAADLGDFPASYLIPALKPHEFPAVGVYVDQRIVPGFRYRIRPIEDENKPQATSKHMFNGRALQLLSIGRGYSRRLTFQADSNALNNNSNYFWSDSRPEGFAFELEVVSPGHKFTLQDTKHAAAGTVEVLQNTAPQEEVSQAVLSDGSIEKRVRICVLCKVEWFENGQSVTVVPIHGLAVAVKPKNGHQNASVTCVMNVTLGTLHRRGYILTPGVNDLCRHTTVLGESIRDIPTRYTITGLETHELPVIGTYVDPRIMPGFYYRVRPAGRKELLFEGQSLLLISIGPGYGKRITFIPDQQNLNAPNNFFWSDSHPDGLGFEPRAVQAGMKFAVIAAGQKLGEGSVFRADAVQQEERQELVRGCDGTTVVKYIHTDVTCHIMFDITHEKRKPDSQVMRVSGTAVVARRPTQAVAQLVRIENIGLSSQLNVLFVTQQANLLFIPL